MLVEVEREQDGRWIAEVPALPGVLVYGATESEARAKAEALALRVIADRLETGSHRTLSRAGWPDYVFAFHDGDEVGPRMLARIAKQTGLKPDDL